MAQYGYGYHTERCATTSMAHGPRGFEMASKSYGYHTERCATIEWRMGPVGFLNGLPTIAEWPSHYPSSNCGDADKKTVRPTIPAATAGTQTRKR